ncbi:TetR/AcrR family transcriptional regulator [Rossellomorea vietnamensis]|uniref:TetR/AcrR family transcriptional regulator n=1 Tax=Rossellomorea vietnamensis TaxID=218284 RepID=UPI001E5726AB|nr:TetR/AcrR family transcriptional regulator [Rossellomorea vietnamensis]MCC5803577.1 TetR/AcrR family transcriptional regulator [Rossellomorea vietnamensis]
MEKGEKKKREIIAKTADYILANGLQSASLRNLAKAANTSDRMLLHYFTNKEELFTVVLSSISQQLISLLQHADIKKQPFHTLVPFLYHMMKDPEVRPYIKLWLELITMASDDDDSLQVVARDICDHFYSFYQEILLVEEGEDVEQLAALALVTVEGIALLDSLGDDSRIGLALQAIEKRSNQ